MNRYEQYMEDKRLKALADMKPVPDVPPQWATSDVTFRFSDYGYMNFYKKPVGYTAIIMGL